MENSSDILRKVAKDLYPPVEDKYKLAGRMCWEILAEFGYTSMKGEFMAYKDLLVKMAIMEAMNKDES